jgi:hypothetical protein
MAENERKVSSGEQVRRTQCTLYPLVPAKAGTQPSALEACCGRECFA